ncbi:MAG: hypothetical protein WCH34_12465 [Bacteroidota bacterium]
MNSILIILLAIVLSELAFILSFMLLTMLMPIISFIIRLNMMSKTFSMIHGFLIGFITIFSSCMVSFIICKSYYVWPYSILIGLIWPTLSENEHRKNLYCSNFKNKTYRVKFFGKFHSFVRNIFEHSLHSYYFSIIAKYNKKKNPDEDLNEDEIREEAIKAVIQFMWNSFILSIIGAAIGLSIVLIILK